jgi:hypothetical protein
MRAFKTFSIGIIAALIPVLAFAARDLSSAASSATSTAGTIAKAASTIGVLIGAIVYQIPGAAMWGRGVITAGLLGAGLAFGGPSIISLFRTIFGG